MSDYLDVIVQKFGLDYVKTNGNEIRYKCPFCAKRRGKPDEDAKLYANIKSGKFHCFKCGASGHLGQNQNISNSGVYSKILSFVTNKETVTDDEEENIFYVPNNKIQKGTVAYNYCLSRNITEDKIDYYDIRLGTDDLFGRIVIPNEVYGDTGIWTDMYSSRTYLDQIPKYKNPSGVKKTDIVFNLHRIPEGVDDIYGTEGVITSICAGKNAVAFYGCHPTDYQIQAVARKNPKNFYACLDNDQAGRKPNLELAEKMSRLISGNVFVVYMPEGVDASDMGENQFIDYVKKNRIIFHSRAYQNVINYVKKL